MIEAFRLTERLSFVAPLGVRFWDTVAGEIVSGGLSVTAYPAHGAGRPTRAVANRSGTFVLHHAYGLGDIERGAGDEEFWQSLPPRAPFVVEVADYEGRFLPFTLDADLPVRGLMRWQHPPGRERLAPETAVPLYASPTRPVPQALAVLRTELGDTSTNGPAAWAVLEAKMNGRLLGRAVADAQGRVALLFAYPEPLDFTSGGGGLSSPLSPPGAFATGPPFLQQEWRVRLDAFYSPAAVSSPPSSISPPGAAARRAPDLYDILAQQPVPLWDGPARAQQLTEVRLRYGRELVVRPAGAASSPPTAPTPLPELFISTAGLTPS